MCQPYLTNLSSLTVGASSPVTRSLRPLNSTPGYTASASPITACCTNPSAVKMEQVTLAPLGQQYLDSLQAAADHLNPLVISSDTVTLQVNELFSMLPRGETQRIGILVVKTEDQTPLAGIESTLNLTLPDGAKNTSELPPTDDQGKASIEIPDQDSIPNGTILVYEVCLKTSSSLPVCEQGSYMIWKAP